MSLTVIDFEPVFPAGQPGRKVVLVVNLPVELPEVWQRRRPHPDDQVLVLQAVVLGVGGVQLPQVEVPVAGL